MIQSLTKNIVVPSFAGVKDIPAKRFRCLEQVSKMTTLGMLF